MVASSPASLAPALALVAGLPAGSRVAVLGSRAWSAPGLVSALVAGLPAGVVVVSGGAGGVDSLAVAAARARGLATSVVPADWARLGRAAGVVRSRELLATCATAVVFVCCGSAGSSASVAAARSLRVPCAVVPCSCAAPVPVASPSLWG